MHSNKENYLWWKYWWWQIQTLFLPRTSMACGCEGWERRVGSLGWWEAQHTPSPTLLQDCPAGLLKVMQGTCRPWSVGPMASGCPRDGFCWQWRHPLTWVWATDLGVSLPWRHASLRSLGAPLISVLLLTIILKHFLNSSRQMCCPASWLPQLTAVIKVSWTLFLSPCAPSSSSLECGWKREKRISWKLAECGFSSLTS